jgi:hypothetical protein
MGAIAPQAGSRPVTATCKGCGRPITWAVSAGAELPLEQVYSYRFEALGVSDPGRPPRVDRSAAVWVSHDAICRSPVNARKEPHP